MPFFKSAAIVLGLWTPKKQNELTKIATQNKRVAKKILSSKKLLGRYAKNGEFCSMAKIIKRSGDKYGADKTASTLRHTFLKKDPRLLLQSLNQLQQTDVELSKALIDNKHFVLKLSQKCEKEFVLCTELLNNKHFVDNNKYQQQLSCLLVHLVKDFQHFSIIEREEESIQRLLFARNQGLVQSFVEQAGDDRVFAEKLLSNQNFQQENFNLNAAKILAGHIESNHSLLLLDHPAITKDVVRTLITHIEVKQSLLDACEQTPTLAAQLMTHSAYLAEDEIEQQQFTNLCFEKFGHDEKFIARLFTCNTPFEPHYNHVVGWLFDAVRYANTEKLALSDFSYGKAFLENDALFNQASYLTIVKILVQFNDKFSDGFISGIYNSLKKDIKNSFAQNVFVLLSENDANVYAFLEKMSFGEKIQLGFNAEELALAKFPHAKALLENKNLLGKTSYLTIAKLLIKFKEQFSDMFLVKLYKTLKKDNKRTKNTSAAHIFTLLSDNDKAVYQLFSEMGLDERMKFMFDDEAFNFEEKNFKELQIQSDAIFAELKNVKVTRKKAGLGRRRSLSENEVLKDTKQEKEGKPSKKRSRKRRIAKFSMEAISRAKGKKIQQTHEANNTSQSSVSVSKPKSPLQKIAEQYRTMPNLPLQEIPPLDLNVIPPYKSSSSSDEEKAEINPMDFSLMFSSSDEENSDSLSYTDNSEMSEDSDSTYSSLILDGGDDDTPLWSTDEEVSISKTEIPVEISEKTPEALSKEDSHVKQLKRSVSQPRGQEIKNEAQEINAKVPAEKPKKERKHSSRKKSAAKQLKRSIAQRLTPDKPSTEESPAHTGERNLEKTREKSSRKRSTSKKIKRSASQQLIPDNKSAEDISCHSDGESIEKISKKSKSSTAKRLKRSASQLFGQNKESAENTSSKPQRRRLSLTHKNKKQNSELPIQTEVVEQGRHFKDRLVENQAVATLIISDEEKLLAMMNQMEIGKPAELSTEDLANVANHWGKDFIAKYLINLIKHISMHNFSGMEKQKFLENINEILNEMSSKKLSDLLITNANNGEFLNNLSTAIAHIKIPNGEELIRKKINIGRKISSEHAKQIIKTKNNSTILELFGAELLPLIKRPKKYKKLLLAAAINNIDLGIIMLKNEQYQKLIYLDAPNARALRAALGKALISHGLSSEGNMFDEHQKLVLEAALDNPETAKALAIQHNKLANIQRLLLTPNCDEKLLPILASWGERLVEHLRNQDILLLANSQQSTSLDHALTILSDGNTNTLVSQKLLDETQWQYSNLRDALFEDNDRAMLARIALGTDLTTYLAKQRTEFIEQHKSVILKTAENNRRFALGIGSQQPCFYALQREIVNNPQYDSIQAKIKEHWGGIFTQKITDYQQPEEKSNRKPFDFYRSRRSQRSRIDANQNRKLEDVALPSEEMLTMFIPLAAENKDIAAALFHYKSGQEYSQLYKATEADLEAKITMLHIIKDKYKDNNKFKHLKENLAYTLKQKMKHARDIKRILNNPAFTWVLSSKDISQIISSKDKLIEDARFLLKLAYQSPELAQITLTVGSLSKANIAKILHFHSGDREFMEKLQKRELRYQNKKPIDLQHIQQDKHAAKIIQSSGILKELKQIPLENKKKNKSLIRKKSKPNRKIQPQQDKQPSPPLENNPPPPPPALPAVLLQKRAPGSPAKVSRKDSLSRNSLLSDIESWGEKPQFKRNITEKDRVEQKASGSLFAELISRSNGKQRDPFIKTPKGIKSQSFAQFMKDLFQLWQKNHPAISEKYSTFAQNKAESFYEAVEAMYNKSKPEQGALEKTIKKFMESLDIDLITVESFQSNSVQGNMIDAYSHSWIDGMKTEYKLRQAPKSQEELLQDSLKDRLNKMRKFVELTHDTDEHSNDPSVSAW